MMNGLEAVTVMSIENRLITLDNRDAGLRLEAGSSVIVAEKE
jgi:hypothetical protein